LVLVTECLTACTIYMKSREGKQLTDFFLRKVTSRGAEGTQHECKNCKIRKVKEKTTKKINKKENVGHGMRELRCLGSQISATRIS